MPARMDVGLSGTTYFTSSVSTSHVVQTQSGTLYIVFTDHGSDLFWTKSTNNGITWTIPVSISTANVMTFAIWYDRWSNISADLIHIAFTESDNDDTLYRNLDTTTDALGTQYTIFEGNSTAAGGCLSITRARGGNLCCHTMIDAGAEGGFYRSTDTGATWGSRTINEALATQDQIILLPGWATDNQDIMAIFWDASADEISRYLYDDSANTWSETSIATSMADFLVNASGFQPGFSAFVDIENSQNVVAAWSGIDTANADLRCWTVTESAITETASNIVLNGTDDQGLVALTKDTVTGYWWAFYGGKSDGSETYNTAWNIYCKISTDSGATWGSEFAVTNVAANYNWIYSIPRWSKNWFVAYTRKNPNTNACPLFVNIPIPRHRASFQLLGG